LDTIRAGSGGAGWERPAGRRPIVPAVRDLLDRFRPGGTPGAAAGAAVPAEPGTRREAELGPVLGRLAATEARCHAILAEASARAADIRATARRQARDLDAETARRVVAARAEAAAQVQAEHDERAAADLAAARAAAEDVRRRSAAGMDRLLGRVVARARDDALAAAAPR
jgi:hypothetical protein